MLRHNSLYFIVFAAILTSVALTAPAAAGPRDHADGFFLRLSSGVGAAGSKIDAGDASFEFTGTGTDLDIAIGAVVSPNLAVHGTLLGWMITDPDGEMNGLDLGKADGDLTATGFGGGLTYYLMPANVYLTGSIGVGSLEFDAGNLSGETDSGLILGFALGKEWWVGDKWGLGAALGVIHHSYPDPDVDENWNGTSFTLRFSATMN
jgi:hypothetical protein